MRAFQNLVGPHHGEFSLKITTITSECLGVPLGAGGGGNGVWARLDLFDA